MPSSNLAAGTFAISTNFSWPTMLGAFSFQLSSD
jgi:hypothetical protein